MNTIRTAALSVLCFLFLGVAQIVSASPTSADYEACHRVAAASLERCLDQHTNTDDGVCWSDARKMKERCYASVHKSYSRHPTEEQKKMEAAASKARQELETKMPQEAK